MAATARVIIYERDCYESIAHGPFDLTEYAAPDLHITWNYYQRQINVWEGTENLDYVPRPWIEPDGVAVEWGDKKLAREKERHDERERGSMARKKRDGKPLTPEQASTLVALAKLKRELDAARKQAKQLFKEELAPMCSLYAGSDDD